MWAANSYQVLISVWPKSCQKIKCLVLRPKVDGHLSYLKYFVENNAFNKKMRQLQLLLKHKHSHLSPSLHLFCLKEKIETRTKALLCPSHSTPFIVPQNCFQPLILLWMNERWKELLKCLMLTDMLHTSFLFIVRLYEILKTIVWWKILYNRQTFHLAFM